jgi:ATP-binding cassette subfamily F protein uup
VHYADYGQWEIAERLAVENATRAAAERQRPAAGRPSNVTERPRRLGYLEQREWEQMEARILGAEERLESCRRAAAEPGIASDHRALHERLAALATSQEEVEALYARWAELEARLKG